MKKKPTGRPRKPIDYRILDCALGMGGTLGECATLLDMSTDTVERAVKRDRHMLFSAYAERFKNIGKTKLRTLQWAAARAGSVRMQIHLGKQYLGQRERPVATITDTVDVRISYAK